MVAPFHAAEVPADLIRRMAGRDPDGGPDGDTWIRELPELVNHAIKAWDLQPTGAPVNGHNAIVLPAQWRGQAAALKVSWPHPEAAVEHLGLRHWDGRGMVKLLAAAPAEFTLLLEGLDFGRDLHGVDIESACGVIGDLLGRLHVEPPPTVPLFREVAGRWLAPLRQYPVSVPRR